MFLGKALLAGSSKFLGKALRTGQYIGKAIPQISKGLSQVQRFASSGAVQQAGKAIGIGPSVFQKVGQIAGSTNAAVSALPGVAADVRAGLTGASSSLTPARKSIADLYQKANSTN
eukprot:15623-Heterococcus_DN1.PRE.2